MDCDWCRYLYFSVIFDKPVPKNLWSTLNPTFPPASQNSSSNIILSRVTHHKESKIKDSGCVIKSYNFIWISRKHQTVSIWFQKLSLVSRNFIPSMALLETDKPTGPSISISSILLERFLRKILSNDILLTFFFLSVSNVININIIGLSHFRLST